MQIRDKGLNKQGCIAHTFLKIAKDNYVYVDSVLDIVFDVFSGCVKGGVGVGAVATLFPTVLFIHAFLPPFSDAMQYSCNNAKV